MRQALLGHVFDFLLSGLVVVVAVARLLLRCRCVRRDDAAGTSICRGFGQICRELADEDNEWYWRWM